MPWARNSESRGKVNNINDSVWNDKFYYLKKMDQCPGSSQREKETSVWRKSQNWAQSGIGKGQPEARQRDQRAVGEVKQRGGLPAGQEV